MNWEKELEPNAHNNHIRSRSCTDVFCAIFFIAYIVSMIVFAIIGYTNGDLKHIAQPFDSDGNMCGRGDQEAFPYLYVNNPLSTNYGNTTICLTSCPKNVTDRPGCKPNTDITDCSKIMIYETYSFLNRICLPRVDAFKAAVQGQLNYAYVHAFVQDIKEAAPMIVAMFFVTLVVVFVYFFLLENCAPCMVFLVLIGSLTALVGGGVFCWQRYKTLIAENPEAAGANDFWYAAIGCWVASGVFLLLILLLLSRIKLATKMIAAAADFITDRMMILLIPLTSALFILAFSVWWVVSFLYVFSIGTLRYDQGDIFGDMVWTPQTEAFVYLMIFGLLWVISFSMSNNQFAVAVLAADWYFSRGSPADEIGIFTAMIWGVTYHLGTIAFGSFVIALLWFIQLILSYLYQKTKEIDPNNFVYKCALCFVSCFERFLKFMNRHAYIEVAIRNLNFCGGIGKSVEILTSNFARFAVLSSLVELFLFLGGIALSALITLIGYFVLQAYGNWRNLQFETIAPLVVFFVLAMLVTNLFNGIFETSADTMLHCYVFEESQAGQPGMGGVNCPAKMKEVIEESAGYYQQLK